MPTYLYGIRCTLPADATIPNAIEISVFAVNAAGPSAGSSTRFFPLFIPPPENEPLNPCEVYQDARGHKELIGRHMRDNIDVRGLDWVKYWSTGNSKARIETATPEACCLTCRNTEGCDYWTWTKTDAYADIQLTEGLGNGCYLKHQSASTVYVMTFFNFHRVYD